MLKYTLAEQMYRWMYDQYDPVTFAEIARWSGVRWTEPSLRKALRECVAAGWILCVGTAARGPAKLYVALDRRQPPDRDRVTNRHNR